MCFENKLNKKNEKVFPRFNNNNERFSPICDLHDRILKKNTRYIGARMHY